MPYSILYQSPLLATILTDAPFLREPSLVVLVPAPARTLTVELALPSLMVAGNTFVVVSLPVLSLPVSVSDETRTYFFMT